MQYLHVYLIQVENDYKRQRSQRGPKKGNEASLPENTCISPLKILKLCTCN